METTWLTDMHNKSTLCRYITFKPLYLFLTTLSNIFQNQEDNLETRLYERMKAPVTKHLEFYVLE